MDARLSRRGFLKATASVTGASLLPPQVLDAGPTRLAMPPGVARSRVAKLESAKLVSGRTVHEQLLREGLAVAMRTLTGSGDVSEAWHRILKPSDSVGIKFNRSAQDTIGTTPSVAAAIVESLLAAGFSPERISCLEAPDDLTRRFHLRTPRTGFNETRYDFRSGRDQLAAALDDVTAIINVPFLKTHNIAGMTCSLKNLSHGLIKHPARYHTNGCSPFIADIVGLQPIRSKLRLNIIDGLRVVYEGGPSAALENIEDAGVLCLSSDPVAADTVALSRLDAIRRTHALPPIAVKDGFLPYLAAAHENRLGIALPFGIDTIDVRL